MITVSKDNATDNHNSFANGQNIAFHEYVFFGCPVINVTQTYMNGEVYVTSLFLAKLFVAPTPKSALSYKTSPMTPFHVPFTIFPVSPVSEEAIL